MPPAPDLIWQVCRDLLAVVEARHGAALPSRRYVSAGAPAWDCELLAAWCEGTTGTDGETVGSVQAIAAHPAWAMRAGTFVATLVRCVPTLKEDGSPPSVSDEQGAAQELYEDATRLSNAVVAGYRAGDIGDCNGLALLDWRVVGPQGGLVAGELRVRIQLTEV